MSQLPIEKVLDALEMVKPCGRDAWMARCPAHADGRPSLKVTLTDTQILTHCYAGCSFDDVVAATPLSKSDFFLPNGHVSLNGHQDKTAWGTRGENPRKVIDHYVYTDASQRPVFRVLRYEPKGFSQERPDGKGGWIRNLDGVKRVPYHLDEVLSATDWIFLCEGEKDADSVRQQGLVGTTFMGGASRTSFEASEVEPFRGKRVALLYDNDDAGRKRKETLLRTLDGIASEVRVVDLPSLPPKGDVTDWFGSGRTGADLLGLAKSPKIVVPDAIVITAADVTPESVDWLWHGRLARGKIALLEGDPGLGKSTLTIEIAAKLSRGGGLPDHPGCLPIGTLFLSGEDGVADTIVPRLVAANANMDRIHILAGRVGQRGAEGITIPADLDLIERTMAAYECNLVIIDPLSAYLGDNVSENKNQEVRRALAPLKDLLERTGAACILLRHLTKAQSATPVYRGAGSIGLAGAARIVMMVADDPDQEGVRVLAGVKENLSVKPQSLAYKVVPCPANPTVPIIEWQGHSIHSAHDLQSPPDDDLGPTLAFAVDWMREYLRGGVTVVSKQFEKDARAAGLSTITYKRARKMLGVVGVKGSDGSWSATLPHDPVRGAGDPLASDDPLAQSRDDTLDTLGKTHVNTTNNNNIYSDLLDDPLQEDHDPLASSQQGDQGDQGDHASTEEEDFPW